MKLWVDPENDNYGVYMGWDHVTEMWGFHANRNVYSPWTATTFMNKCWRKDINGLLVLALEKHEMVRFLVKVFEAGHFARLCLHLVALSVAIPESFKILVGVPKGGRPGLEKDLSMKKLFKNARNPLFFSDMYVK
jgi:hypothetical protein